MRNLGHSLSGTFVFRFFFIADLACFFFSEAPALAADPVKVLFVKNGYYQQETYILNHLNSLGCYQVTTLKDSQVKSTTNLTVYDLIIITEFAPGISSYGINNIKNSGKPVMIVEYWDFWYSYKLGLVEDDWAGYYGTKTVDVIDAEHPITYLFDDTITVYNPSYTVYGIPMEDIKAGVSPLIYSSESFDEVAVIADDARKYVATGIYDTRKYTADGWRLFDTILTYLHEPGPLFLQPGIFGPPPIWWTPEIG